MTLDEAAKALGCAKRSVLNYLSDLGVSPKDESGRLSISEDLLVKLSEVKEARRKRMRTALKREPAEETATEPALARDEMICPACGRVWSVTRDGPTYKIMRFPPGHPEFTMRRFNNLSTGPLCFYCLQDRFKDITLQKP